MDLIISPPASATLERRRSIELISPASHYSQYWHYSQYSQSTTSSSSPEFTTDATAITPDSDDDDDDTSPDEHDDYTGVVPKIEELDDNALLHDAKPSIVASEELPSAPRKRGRPRKHPVLTEKKTSHARSKTGCGTCRRRKKKCDETKPTCTNCQKNNVVCDGYEPKQPWRSGKQKTLTIRRPSILAELPPLVQGVDGAVDQMFLRHFTSQVAKVLSLTDQQNPFLDIIVPMAMEHAGLMHSLLYLSGTCLVANPTVTFKNEWEQRQRHHSSQALVLLHADLEKTRDPTNNNNALYRVGDPSIAQTLVLCLQTVCAGNLNGDYRHHLNGMKEMLLAPQGSFPNEQLRHFILEFLLYHDYSSSITSLVNPLDQRSFSLMEDFKLPGYMIQPSAATLLGVMDGLFGFISRIRHIRDQIRQRRALGRTWWDENIWDEAFAIDKRLRAWECKYDAESPRYVASLLYRQCTFIYLHRTIHPSRPSAQFKQAVDEGLQYLRRLPWKTDDAGSTQSILLMPLFLLGCAAFEPEQRPEISQAFRRLQEWSSLGNIKYARAIVEQIWQMMDQGREEETWDWETIIALQGWDFLVT